MFERSHCYNILYFKMTFLTLSELVANLTSVITLRGPKAYELIQGIKETSNLSVNLETLVCKIQRLTFNQRLMHSTHLPDGQVTFITFYGDKTYHPRVLFTQDKGHDKSKVTKQPLLPNKLVQVTGPADYKILLNRLDVNHEAYVLMIYQESDQVQTQPKIALTELIKFQESQPCSELTNTINDLEDALDHLDNTIEEGLEDLQSDLFYNLESTLGTTQGPYEVDL